MDSSAKRAELRSSGIDSSFRGKREDHFCRSRDEKKAGRVLEVCTAADIQRDAASSKGRGALGPDWAGRSS